VRRGGVHAVVHALDIDRENSIKVTFRCAFQVANVGDSGIVYQDVDAPFLENRIEDRHHGFLTGNVAAIGLRVSPLGCDFADNSLGRIFIDVQHTHKSSTAGKSLSNGAADAACSPGHDGELAVKAKSL